MAPTLCGSVTWSRTSRGRRLGSVLENVGEEQVVQPLDLGDQPLVRRVLRHEPAEVRDVGEGEGHVLRKLDLGRRLAGRPDPDHLTLRIGERRRDRVSPPETGTVLRLGGGSGFAAHGGFMA